MDFYVHWNGLENQQSPLFVMNKEVWAKITYLKSAATLLFKLSANKYDLVLSNESLVIIIGQGAPKLLPFKVGS